MVGFALGLNQSRRFTDYLDPSVLESAFDASQKALFSFALAKTALGYEDGVKLGDGSWKSSYNAVIIYRTLALIVEVTLGIILCLTILLAISCYRAPSNIGSDPSSLLQTVLNLKGPDSQLTEFSQCGHLSRDELIKKFIGTRYRLVCSCDPLSIHGQLQRVDGLPGSRPQLPNGEEISEEKMAFHKPYFPPVLQPWTGILFTGAVTGLFGFVIFLADRSRKSWGISPPFAQQWRNAILFTYIPTHIGTFIEPFFGLINQSFAMFRSVSQLERRGQSNRHTVASRYMTIPPQFNIVRAFKVGDYRLTISCLLTFLASALSIALSMLFSSSNKYKPTPMPMTQPYNSYWNTTVLSQYLKNGTQWGPEYLDPAYLLYAYNQSTYSPYPWTTNSTYYTPAILPTGKYDIAYLTVRGFTPDFICVRSIAPVQSVGFSLMGHSFTFPADELKNESCSVDQFPETKPVMPYAYDDNLTGPATSEGFSVLSDYGSSCGLVFGWYWARWSAYGSPSGTVTTTSLACKAGVRTAMYEVRVDASGYILTSKHLEDSSFQSIPDHMLKTSEIISLIVNMWGGQGSSNLSVATTVMGSLLHKSGNDSLFDPQAPIPDIYSTAQAIKFWLRASVVQFFAMNPSVLQEADVIIRGSIDIITLSRGFLAEGGGSEGDNRYGFGVYTGLDGRVQFGIDNLCNLRNLPETGKP
ncbi:hypothetical protein F503_02662 [Ophiostoma piceae UAMH 11346]|uniref:Uncharacterized protein n=1 Tax=Ophiostoma piceae (strain UAMH 11346) TaxID=1262450 RepID=S3BZ30_OPHP1|nr:hypothetical protein F503_02662 [Ophiostoma piceae UAMH 11346]